MAEPLESARVPPEMVVMPVKVLVPASVWVPVPTLFNVSMLVPSTSEPLKLPVASPLPTVSTPAVAELVTVPDPDSPLMLALAPVRPLMSRMPLTIRLPLPAPNGRMLSPPNRMVPAVRVVSPV